MVFIFKDKNFKFKILGQTLMYVVSFFNLLTLIYTVKYFNNKMKRRKEREYFEVEAICSCRSCPDTKRKEFLVKWKGFYLFFILLKTFLYLPNGFLYQIVLIYKSLQLPLTEACSQ